MSTARVLVVDDEEFVRESLQELLEARGYEVFTAVGGVAAAELLRKEEVDVVLTDMKMPEGDGQALLQIARSEGVDVPILVLTGASSVGEAVAAMKTGAYDLLEKPVDPEHLTHALERALERGRLRREVAGLRSTLRLARTGRRWIASSPAALRVSAAIERAAKSDAPVLLTGPSGVGKAVVAEELHRASARAANSFVRVDCAALEPDVLPQVLFGQRGSSDGEERADSIGRVALARGGTLVLDEISMISLEAQGRLSRLLERGEFERVGEARPRQSDVRVIASTNQRLRERVERGAFREDLYWRLDVLRIDVPTLEQRREDLIDLARELARELGRSAHSAPDLAFTPDAEALLLAYPWPGNALELRSVIERALLIRGDASGELDADVISGALDAQLDAIRRPAGVKAGGPPGQELLIRANLLALERSLVLQALGRSKGRRSEAADLLGIDARNLGYYFRKHKITDEELERTARG